MFSAFTFSVFFSTEKNSTYAQLRHREVTQWWVGFFFHGGLNMSGKVAYPKHVVQVPIYFRIFCTTVGCESDSSR